MSQITFSRLRDSEDWGLRGTKEELTEHPPAEGTMVTVTKRNGDTQEVEMGKVIAQGDDWWLATVGGTSQTKPSDHRTNEHERQIAELVNEVRELKHAVKVLKHHVDELQMDANARMDAEVDRNADADERAAIQAEGDGPKEANPWA